MPWIEFHSDELLDSQKFQDFRVKMSWTENEALGFMGRFWGKVLKLRESGDISGWRPDYVARLTDAKAHPEALWEALRGSWLDEVGGRVLVHDWLSYAGTYLRGRYKTRQKEKLVEIWALHGKTYGSHGDQEEEGSTREVRGKYAGILPTVPTVPNLTKPTVPDETPTDSNFNHGRTVGGLGTSIIEATLMTKPWHFKGDHHMKRTGDLPPDYCRWALRSLEKLSAEERLACEIIVAKEKK